MTVFFIIVFLFSYVNSTMFFHSHSFGRNTVVHSHISTKAHRSDNGRAEKHSTAQVLHISEANHVSYTDASIQHFNLQPEGQSVIRVVGTTTSVSLSTFEIQHGLRAPPVLV